jgi:hypothetical protein
MAQFGGEMQFRLSTGERLKMRGEFSVEASRYENSVVTNQDGSNSKNVALKPYRLSCTFEDKAAADYDALLREHGVNATVVEDYTSTRHLFTGGFFEGTPEVDRITGEVSGLMFVSDTYQKVTR